MINKSFASLGNTNRRCCPKHVRVSNYRASSCRAPEGQKGASWHRLHLHTEGVTPKVSHRRCHTEGVTPKVSHRRCVRCTCLEYSNHTFCVLCPEGTSRRNRSCPSQIEDLCGARTAHLLVPKGQGNNKSKICVGQHT